MKNSIQPKMKICESAFNEIINFIASKNAESGGALFGSKDDYVIRRFIPDKHAVTTGSTYSINAEYLNRIIKKLWEEEELALIGIIHSHPRGCSTLSGPDVQYFRSLLNSMQREQFYTPIVYTVPDGGFKLFPYVLNSDGTSAKEAQLEIVPDHHPFVNKTDTEQSLLAWLLPEIKIPEIPVIDWLKKLVKIEALLLAGIIMAYAGWFIISLTPPLIENIINFLIS